MTTTGTEDRVSAPNGSHGREPLAGAPRPSGSRRSGTSRRVLALRELTPGLVTLLVVAAAYPFLTRVATEPVGVFLLPPMVTAVLGGWRPTLLIGAVSFATAVVIGAVGSLPVGTLLVRWAIIMAVIGLAAVGARVREAQRTELTDLGEGAALREAFERTLAPVPVPPRGFVVVGHYQPASSHMMIGGDFLEAITIGDGRLAVLMGDVCGHGPREAAHGAALRAGWKSIALAGEHDPARWVESLDEAFFRDGRIETYVTLCTGFLDLPTRSARLVNVAHPPPIVLAPTPHELQLPASPPLGLNLTTQWTSVELPWRREPMVLYTDGLVENPSIGGRLPRRWGSDGLLQWLQGHAGDDARQLVPDLIAAASDERALNDDIAVLMITAGAD